MSDTPETDEQVNGKPCTRFQIAVGDSLRDALVPSEFARRLERERDEAREEAAHWKTEYEIVVARLCGKKHPRDNGIISEQEIIPKLEHERDTAIIERDQVIDMWSHLYACTHSIVSCLETYHPEMKNAISDLTEALKKTSWKKKHEWPNL